MLTTFHPHPAPWCLPEVPDVTGGVLRVPIFDQDVLLTRVVVFEGLVMNHSGLDGPDALDQLRLPGLARSRVSPTASEREVRVELIGQTSSAGTQAHRPGDRIGSVARSVNSPAVHGPSSFLGALTLH